MIFVTYVFRTPGVVSVVVGEHQRSATSTVRQTLTVSSIFIHEDYSSRTNQNDIALIKLSADISLNENVWPVCAADPVNDYAYTKCQCSGWGTLVSGEQRGSSGKLVQLNAFVIRGGDDKAVMQVAVYDRLYPVFMIYHAVRYTWFHAQLDIHAKSISTLYPPAMPELSTGHISWTRPGETLTRPDPTRDCRQKVWPDPTRGPTLNSPICIVFNWIIIHQLVKHRRKSINPNVVFEESYQYRYQ